MPSPPAPSCSSPVPASTCEFAQGAPGPLEGGTPSVFGDWVRVCLIWERKRVMVGLLPVGVGVEFKGLDTTGVVGGGGI